MLYSEPNLIERQPKGSFAGFVRGVTAAAVPLKFPFGHIEQMEKMSSEEAGILRDRMREKYALPIEALTPSEEEDLQTEESATEAAKEAPKKSNNPPKTNDGGVSIEPSDKW